MRHVLIWSPSPKDREKERQRIRGYKLGVKDTEGERGSSHPVGTAVSKPQFQSSMRRWLRFTTPHRFRKRILAAGNFTTT